MYPLAAAKPNTRYIGEIYSISTCRDLRSVLEPQNIRFVYPDEASVDVPLDSLAALELGDRVLLDAESLELLEAACLKHHRHGLAGRVLGIDHLASRVLAGEREDALLEYLTMVPYYFWGAYNIAEMNSSTNVTRHLSIGDEKQSPARLFTANNTPSYLNSFDNLPMPTEDFVVDVLPGLRRLLYPRQRGGPYSGGGRGRALAARPCLRLNGAAGTASPTPGDGCRTAQALAARAKWLQAVVMRPISFDPRPVPPPHRRPNSGIASSGRLVDGRGCPAAHGPGSGQPGPGRNRTRA